MLNKLSEESAACYKHADDCARRLYLCAIGRFDRADTLLRPSPRERGRNTSVAAANISVVVIRAFSIGLAISSAIFLLLRMPTILQRQTAAIPPLLDTRSASTDGSAARQQASVITPPPPEELEVGDELSIGQRGGSHPPGFRGLAWGSPPTSTMVKVGGPFGPLKVSIWRDANGKLNPAFGASVTEESYFFRGGDLYGGELIFDGLDNFRKVRGGLTAVLGTPNFADEDNQIFKWQWQNPDIELRISYQKVSHRSVLHLEQKRQPVAGDGGPHAGAHCVRGSGYVRWRPDPGPGVARENFHPRAAKTECEPSPIPVPAISVASWRRKSW